MWPSFMVALTPCVVSLLYLALQASFLGGSDFHLEHTDTDNGFEGSLQVIGLDDGQWSKLNNNEQIYRQDVNLCGGVIHIKDSDNVNFLSEIHDGDHTINLMSFIMTVSDISRLKQHVANQDVLDKEWKIKQLSINDKLIEEERQYQDVLLVDILDVYRNLPQKLVSFHKWIHENLNAKFVLKTDDDCFVNIYGILSSLGSPQQYDPYFWWGSFRENWIVQHHGKWAENTYSADVYPRFACGSGNVVSGNISAWLADNNRHLHFYQGEDVSMGIWLSALSTSFIQDNRWKCTKECSGDLLVMPQLSVEEMNAMWKNHQICENPCDCDT